MTLAPYYDFRRSLVEALKRDIVGPRGGEHEIIGDDPVSFYISGVLFPQSGTLAPELDVGSADDATDEEVPDPPVALANVRYPSSMGMTFAVDLLAADHIVVTLSAARYILLPEEDGTGASTSVWQRRKKSERRWQHAPLGLRPVTVDVTGARSYYEDEIDDPHLRLFVRVRVPDENGRVAVTLALVNTEKFDFDAAEIPLRDAYAFYQPEIRVTAPEATKPPFVERPVVASLGHDEDLASYRLLYRHSKEFAAGHGCSVTWEPAPEHPDRALSVTTTFIPEYDLRVAHSNPAIRSDATPLAFLVEEPRDRVIAGLHSFADDYLAWIDDLKQAVPSLAPQVHETAGEHIARCETALGRIRRGIDLLTDDTIWQAFRLANRAIWEQFARSRWLRSGRPTPAPTLDPQAAWYPFQLAFILLCLEGISRPDSADRELVDLLWFPTGGGKTEAYLGLIAFTVFLRRLRYGAEGGGVTAIMRYTLRLLTLQQFQRAAVLVTTCEDIRRRTPVLGDEPIAIAMWVGQKSTPNTLDEARESLDKLRVSGEESLEEKNPIQLQNCPWCGEPLGHRNYWIADVNRRLVISCKRTDCSFGNGLPIYVVDEDIYNFRPTLIISTVDKFAGLPWRDRSAALFNLPENGSSRHLPPELIIQDELHLISGPLGTLTGLYETAVDVLCSNAGRPPKVIASTATIRRAADQTLGLFGRQVRQFPPPGLDARNSYFAVEAPPHDKGTRLYLGLMAPATSHTTLLVRAYAGLLQSVYELEASPSPAVKDPYWTLLGYFNSLRVLGGARLQVDDDVKDRIGLVAKLDGAPARPIEAVVELTSREPSGMIRQRLDQLSVEHPDPFALDVVLATNMISVGVDIDRLGLMLVMGQPQSASEYIQATSRVGRKYPGLVGVLFNGAKSRDRSHYESFVAFHSAVYRQVEASSVTPFSARARDRGLHAVLIALARMLYPEFRPNRGASAVAVAESKLRTVADLILERVRVIAPAEADATAVQLDEIIGKWRKRAAALDGKLVFSNPYSPDKTLLTAAGMDDMASEDTFDTLWSLRDVDRESNLYLVYLGKKQE